MPKTLVIHYAGLSQKLAHGVEVCFSIPLTDFKLGMKFIPDVAGQYQVCYRRYSTAANGQTEWTKPKYAYFDGTRWWTDDSCAKRLVLSGVFETMYWRGLSQDPAPYRRVLDALTVLVPKQIKGKR